MERVHKWLGEKLRIWKRGQQANWHHALPYLQMAHQMLPNSRSGKSPFELLFGIEGKLPFVRRGVIQGSYSLLAEEHHKQHRLRLQAVREDVLRLEKEIQQREAARFNKKSLEMQLPVGSKAIVYTKGTKHKLECVWSDLVEVVRQADANTYVHGSLSFRPSGGSAGDTPEADQPMGSLGGGCCGSVFQGVS